MRANKFLSIAALLILSINTANADDISIGIMGGKSNFNGLTDDCPGFCSSEDTDTAVGINLAYSFNRVWGLEVGYLDFGSTTLNGSSFTSNDSNFLGGINFTVYTVDVDASALYLAGSATAHFTENLSFTGRLGVASLDAAASSDTVSVTASDDGANLHTSISLDYNFTKAFSVGLRLDSVSDFSAGTIALKTTF